jgi:hypothetical protein
VPSFRQRRRHGHDARRVAVRERADQRVDESVEPAPEISFQLGTCGERGHRSACVHHEKDLTESLPEAHARHVQQAAGLQVGVVQDDRNGRVRWAGSNRLDELTASKR